MLTSLSGLATMLGRINDGFYHAVDTSVAGGLGDSLGRSKLIPKVTNAYALYLGGYKTAKDAVSFLKHTPGSKAENLDFTSHGTEMPTKVALSQNYPNPFNPTTTINVEIPEDMDGAVATLKVYNVLGQEVASVLNSEAMSAGVNAVTFDASKLASGVYFYRLSLNGGEITAMKKMMLLK